MLQISYNVQSQDWKKKFPLYKKHITQTVNLTIKTLGINLSRNISVSFLLTSNENIKNLNQKYRKRNMPTNVLSFPMKVDIGDYFVLGDIVLASEVLLKESIELNIKKYDHLSRMTIHGMLHLFGYDHQTNKQFNEMNKLEKIIFESL